MQIDPLKPIIEAALLASTQPMSVHQLEDLFNEDEKVDGQQIAQALESLAGDCAGRGIELKEVASGFRYQVRQDVHPWISRMWTERPSRYSRALLETLALIAYRQPITRPEIEQIRGVVVSSNIIKTMEEREWIRVVGHRDVPGKPALFGTTRAFLDYFSLKSLDQLPSLSEIRDMEDPQLRFEPEPLPVRVVRDLPIDPDAVDPDAVNPDDADPGDVLPAESETETETSANAIDVGDDDTTTDAEVDAAAFTDDEASSDPAALAIHPTTTADEAATPAADVPSDAADQDTEEYRA
ncbi:MAG TPA: SMC-Scp complex subunit ScpB [Rhodanobacter sp.]|jgi:segregation and condensation protein B|nr:SMC-Scp complex subunit ScpB [Rhodanobacter sp.]